MALVAEALLKHLKHHHHLPAFRTRHVAAREHTASATRSCTSARMNECGAQISRRWLAPFDLWLSPKGKV